MNIIIAASSDLLLILAAFPEKKGCRVPIEDRGGVRR